MILHRLDPCTNGMVSGQRQQIGLQMKKTPRQQIKEIQLTVYRMRIKGIGRSGRGSARNTVVVIASEVDVGSGRAICMCDQSMSDNK